MRFFPIIPWLALAAACGDKAADTGAEAPATSETRSALSGGGLYRVSYTPDPDPIPFNEPFGMLVHATAADGAVVDDLSIAVDATMPEHGHGMNTTPTVENLGDGDFQVDGMMFHMEGAWRIEVDLDGSPGADSAWFDVTCCS